jgi:hypothetical protein
MARDLNTPGKEALFDNIMQSGISLPMSNTAYDRWQELLLISDFKLAGSSSLRVCLPPQDIQDIKDFARQFGLMDTTLLRTFCQLGLRALKAAQMQDEVYKAQYHMREALKLAHHLSANDRRAIREHLVNLNSQSPPPQDGGNHE